VLRIEITLFPLLVIVHVPEALDMVEDDGETARRAVSLAGKDLILNGVREKVRIVQKAALYYESMRIDLFEKLIDSKCARTLIANFASVSLV